MVKIGKTDDDKPQEAPNDEKSKTTINDLAPDCFSLTLSRIPLKDSVMFKSVSRFWFSVINRFVMNDVPFDACENEVLICSSSQSSTKKRISLLQINASPITVLEINKVLATRRKYPQELSFTDFAKHMIVSGSVNGIVCLCSSSRHLSTKIVVLWNPATMHWKPIYLPKAKNWKNFSIALGFDNANDDFRIIFIVPLWLSNGTSRVEIYSVNTDTWEIGGETRIIPLRTVNCWGCKFTIKGVPYWTGIDKQLGSSEILATIDPSTGVYGRYQYPKHNKGYPVYLVNLKGSVAALVEHLYQNRARFVQLYVLDTDSSMWTKMFTVGPLICDGYYIPQSLRGELVIATMTRIDMLQKVTYICDPSKNCMIRNKGVEDLSPNWNESYCHIESLVHLKGMIPYWESAHQIEQQE